MNPLFDRQARKTEGVFIKHFNEDPEHVFKSCGRIEFLGNHTDHNNGMSLVASCGNMFMLAATKVNKTSIVRIKSEKYNEFSVDTKQLDFEPSDAGTSKGLVKGVLACFKKLGYKIGGMDIAICSWVPRGSGVSSSAAFSVLIGKIFSYYFNGDNVKHIELALFAQYAENTFFKKSSGLLDQIGCISKGFSFVDFKNPKKPVIKSVRNPLLGYKLFIIDTETSHQNLSDEYSSIPNDMKFIAAKFNKNVLRDVSEVEFMKAYQNCDIDEKPKFDRALHFFDENKRVNGCFYALKENKLDDVCGYLTASGLSSQKLLRNVTPSKYKVPSEYEVYLNYFRAIINDGGIRVHGGGFGGTLLAMVRENEVESFLKEAEKMLSKKSLIEVQPSFDPLCVIK